MDLSTHHVGIVVSDLPEAVAFYRDALGLREVAEFTLSGDGIGTAIGAEGVSGDFVHLAADGARVELIEYDPAEGPGDAAAINALGEKHVGFAVEDVEAFHEDLPDGVDPISAPQSVETGTSILFFRDPDGNAVEVVEA